jgi:hypothetical protein
MKYVYYVVTYKSDYRRGLDWWLDFLTTYTLTTHAYNLHITDSYKQVFSAY